MCRDFKLQPVWLGDQTICARLCSKHHEQITGEPMPNVPPIPPPQDLPPMGLPWTVIAPGLRARPRPGGTELECFTQDERLGAVPQCSWLLTEDALCDLLIVSSCYHGESSADKAMVRLQLVRLLRGHAETGERKEVTP
jgi:hypothetical protein